MSRTQTYEWCELFRRGSEKQKKCHSGSLQTMMNSYFITLIWFLFLTLIVSWNLCSRDAFCPAFCRPLGVCFCFCGLQSTKKFNPRCEPRLNRVPYMDMIQVTKHWETSKYVYQSRICWISNFCLSWRYYTYQKIKSWNTIRPPHWSLTWPSTPVRHAFLSGFCTDGLFARRNWLIILISHY